MCIRDSFLAAHALRAYLRLLFQCLYCRAALGILAEKEKQGAYGIVSVSYTHLLNPLTDENGKPAYCKEEIKWYENSWDAAEDHAFGSAVDTYYGYIYEHLINGAEFPVKNEKVKQQIAIAEVIHNQNPLSRFIERAVSYTHLGLNETDFFG